MKKTVTLWEYKVGINAIIANFVCMWKSRMPFVSPRNLLKVEHKKLKATTKANLWVTKKMDS